MSLRDFIRANEQRYIQWLTEACSMMSLADEPTGLQEMVSWLEEKLAQIGFETERLTVPNAPDALLARIGSGTGTILVYDHYDVQPVDPLDGR